MQKLDIINELRHMQEQNRTMANVLTAIIRQLEKDDKDKTIKPSDNSRTIKSAYKKCDNCSGDLITDIEDKRGRCDSCYYAD